MPRAQRKTLLLTHEYYPYHGGVARYCYNLFRDLPNDAYMVMTDQRVGDGATNVVRTRLLSPLIRPRWVYALIKLRFFVRRHRIRCIVTPHILPLGIVAYHIRRWLGVPYVISLHGFDINLALERRRATTEKILRSASAIISNSEATKATIAGLSLTAPVVVITPSLAPIHEDTARTEELRRQFEGKSVILTVGRLEKRKGQDMVIQSMTAILRSVPDAHYVMVGEGRDRRYLEEIVAEEGVVGQVTFAGSVSDDEIGSYYAIATVFAMPTRQIGSDVEGFGIVYLEAASYGLPIVAGDVGGVREAVGGPESALLVNGSSTAQLIECLVSVLQDSELARYLGDAARERARSFVTWHQQSEKLQHLLEKI